MKITSSMLPGGMEFDDRNFEHEFGEEVELTKEVLLRMFDLGIGYDVIIKLVLPPIKEDEYNKEIGKFYILKKEATQPFWDAYHRVCATSAAEAERISKEAMLVCNTNTAPIEREIEREAVKAYWDIIEPFVKLL